MLQFDEVHGLLSFSFVFDEVAVLGQLADQWIDLVQAQRQLRMSLQVAAYEAVFIGAHFERRGAGMSTLATPYFLASDNTPRMRRTCGLAVLAVQTAAERADLLTGVIGAAQQLQCAQRCIDRKST